MSPCFFTVCKNNKNKNKSGLELISESLVQENLSPVGLDKKDMEQSCDLTIKLLHIYPRKGEKNVYTHKSVICYL